MHPTGLDTEPLASAKLTNGASESSDDTGQMSLFGETCENLRVNLLPTPCVQDATRDGRTIRNGHNLQTGGLHNVSLVNAIEHPESPSSPQAIPASHSHSPGSAWARKMTGTYGRKFADYWLSSDPPDSWVKTLLGTSLWGSMTCYLTWKKSATPQGRLLFRLVPSTHRTDGIASGFWGTPTTRDHKDTGDMTNVPVNGLLGRQVLMPTPSANEMTTSDRGKLIERRKRCKETAKNGNGFGLTLGNQLVMDGTATNGLKLNSAWVSRMMGYPDDWLTLDGEATP